MRRPLAGHCGRYARSRAAADFFSSQEHAFDSRSYFVLYLFLNAQLLREFGMLPFSGSHPKGVHQHQADG